MNRIKCTNQWNINCHFQSQ